MHARYDELADEAQAKGVSVLEEMQAQGYSRPEDFSDACPQFPLLCWPGRLAELGSGTVLYFYFLIFLGVTMLTMFILHYPMLSVYSKQNIPGSWGNAGSWGSLYDMGGDSFCECLGLDMHLLDGGYCNAWDTWQFECNSEPMPKWCCNAWCYAGAGCPTVDNLEDPSLSNRYMGDGLVRSYSACDQVAHGTCRADVTYTDEAYSHMVQGYNSSGFTLTGINAYANDNPGQWGPNSITADYIIPIYVMAVVVLCAYTGFTLQFQSYMDRQVDKRTADPNDFAVLVRGLPVTATDEAGLQAFFEEHSVRGQKTEVVKVVIGWDVEEFREKMKDLRGYKQALDNLPPDHPRIAAIKEKMASINAELKSTAPGVATRMKSSGIVLVVFRRACDMRSCLERWTGFWARWFYCDADDLCFCCPGGISKGAELPRYPIGNPPRPVFRLTFERAANPGDILWEELGVDRTEKLKRFAKTNVSMAAVILVSLLANYGFTVLQKSVGGNWTTYFRIFVRIIMNIGLMSCATTLGDQEYHETWTSQESSQCIKMAIGMIVNTGLVPFLVDPKPDTWYMVGGMISDIFTMMVLQCVLLPWLQLLDLPFMLKSSKRSAVTGEMIDNWNNTLQANAGAETAEQKLAILGVRKQVNTIKRSAFSPSPFNPRRRYANALKLFFCCLFFTPVTPWISFVGFVGLALQYWIDKYLLLRWYQKPERVSNLLMARYSTMMVKAVGPGCLTFSFIIFLMPSWENKGLVFGEGIAAAFISIAFGMAPFKLLRKLRNCKCSTRLGYGVPQDTPLAPGEDYYQVQYLWAKEFKYHKDHFMYKNLPESVNPEFFKPGESAALKADALKDGFAEAAGKTAASVSAGDKPAAMRKRPGAHGAAASVTWEFEVGHGGWEAFENDCQRFVERQYQKYCNGGRSRINVKTSGMEVSIDFERMTSKVSSSQKIRHIRRSK